MTSKVTDLIDEVRRGAAPYVLQSMTAAADEELKRWAIQRADFVDRVRALEQKDRDNERFCKELLIKCGAALSAANAALKVDWSQMNYGGTQPLPAFIKALEAYAAEATA